MVKLFSKNSNLCDHNPPTSQTDGQTDDMRSQDRALHYSASRGKQDNQIILTSTNVNRRRFSQFFTWRFLRSRFMFGNTYFDVTCNVLLHYLVKVVIQ